MLIFELKMKLIQGNKFSVFNKIMGSVLVAIMLLARVLFTLKRETSMCWTYFAVS